MTGPVVFKLKQTSDLILAYLGAGSASSAIVGGRLFFFLGQELVSCLMELQYV